MLLTRKHVRKVDDNMSFGHALHLLFMSYFIVRTESKSFHLFVSYTLDKTGQRDRWIDGHVTDYVLSEKNIIYCERNSSPKFSSCINDSSGQHISDFQRNCFFANINGMQTRRL